MIYFLSMLISICLQFGAVTPYNMQVNNYENIQYIQDVKQKIGGNYQGWFSSYKDFIDVPDEEWIVYKGFTLWGSYHSDYIVVMCPSGKNYSVECNGYTIDSSNNVNSVTLLFNHYTGFIWTGSSYQYVDSDTNIYGYTQYYFDSPDNHRMLAYYTKDIVYNDNLVVTDIYNPTFSAPGWDMGALSSSGAYLPDTPFKNVLAHLPLFQQTDEYLKNIRDNTITGFTALYNGVGDGLKNIHQNIDYITQPLDLKNIHTKMDNLSMYKNSKTLVNEFKNIMQDKVIGMSDDIIISYDFSTTGLIYFRNCVGTFNLTRALGPSKHIWQPIIIICMYASMVMYFVRNVPSLLSGAGSAGAHAVSTINANL